MKQRILISLILVSLVFVVKAQWTGSATIDGVCWRNGSIQIGVEQVNSYLMINTGSRSWWTGVGINSGDNRFVIYDATASLHRLTIGTDGNVGIGTGADFPVYKLDVNGTGRFGASALIGTGIAAGYYQDATNGAYRSLNVGVNTGYYFQNYNGVTTTMFIGLQGSYAGNVGIGTIFPVYKLDVCGTIRAKEVKVDLEGGCDFVFKTDYKLMDLSSLEQFVKMNHHLPEIASEKEMVESGVNMKEMQMKLLQKMEEMTLYVIDLKKENEKLTLYLIEQNKGLKEQAKKIETLEKAVSNLISK